MLAPSHGAEPGSKPGGVTKAGYEPDRRPGGRARSEAPFCPVLLGWPRMRRFQRCDAGSNPAQDADALVARMDRRPPSKRNDAGSSPAERTTRPCLRNQAAALRTRRAGVRLPPGTQRLGRQHATAFHTGGVAGAAPARARTACSAGAARTVGDGEVAGSIPARLTATWRPVCTGRSLEGSRTVGRRAPRSSAWSSGKTPARQAGDRRFDPCRAHRSLI